MSEKASNLPTVEDAPLQPQNPGFTNTDLERIGAVDKTHHAVQEIGTSIMEKSHEDGIAELVSEFIYEKDAEWVREQLQNHESACIRRGKFLIEISDKYPDDWLSVEFWVDAETGETLIEPHSDQFALAKFQTESSPNVRKVKVSRTPEEVLTASRSLGYDPTITIDAYLDERRIVTQDNGDGMTPTEFDEHFNTLTGSKSKHDSETGGMIGIGSESSVMVHGKDGQMLLATRSTHPDEDGNIRKGFCASSELGGGNIVPGEVEDGFIGTKFDIPVKEDFDMTNLQDWVEDYTEMLSVPVLYREHDAGSTPVEEEYEATGFVDNYDNPPIAIERPGEFSVVAGPDVLPKTGYGEPDPPDTFLVSMKIDRNTRHRMITFWDVVIQIHDEQQRIISGPNRGRFYDDIDDIHHNDVVLPKPTGDRGRLQKSDEARDFFKYVESVVQSEEVRQAHDVVEEMNEADHPGDVVRDSENNWNIFKKVLSYHGSHKTTSSERKFKEFIENRDELPDLDDDVATQAFNLFTEVEHCHRGAGGSSKISSRTETQLGNILSEYEPDNIYMAASTGGNFTKRFRVVENTHDDATVIVVDGASKYDKWGNLFGFNVLKEVPLKSEKDENDEYDIPSRIEEAQKNKGTTTSKPEKTEDRTLKIRTDDDSAAIDMRYSVQKVRDRLENGGKIGGHEKLLLFPSTHERNISDNYGMSKYAAIASVTKKEYKALSDLDDVVTYEEFVEWSESTPIATEDGRMTPEELVTDDRLVILAYRTSAIFKQVTKLLSDEHETMREYYCNDIRDQFKWARLLDGFDGGYGGDDRGNVPDIAKPDTLYAVAGGDTIRQAEYAFDQMMIKDTEMVCLNLNGRYGWKNPTSYKRLDKSHDRYELMANTPNWHDSSAVYDVMDRKSSQLKTLYLGFHERGIDPTNYSDEELQEMIVQ